MTERIVRRPPWCSKYGNLALPPKKTSKVFGSVIIFVLPLAVLAFAILAPFILVIKPGGFQLIFLKGKNLVEADMSPIVTEACGFLAAELARTRHILRSTRRERLRDSLRTPAWRNSLGLTRLGLEKRGSRKNGTGIEDIASWSRGAKAEAGAGTLAWSGRGASLWGVRLWREPPPQADLAISGGTAHGDCWPFEGSSGSLVVHLWRRARVLGLVLEHARPDSHGSAPKDFILHGILVNGTQVELTHGLYSTSGLSRQMFSVLPAPLVTRVALTVLANHGNKRYTCLYRVRILAETTN